jgi:GTP-binding protein EngB required for normal cell division
MKANKLKSLLIVKCFVFGSLFMEIQGADEEKDPREEPAAATLSAVSNEDLSRFTNPRKIARIERTLSEAISNVESACGKDVVLILGNTHAGKSTIVNYLLGCTMKIEGGSRAVPTALTSSMARANTKYGSSETKFPAVYEFEDRYALCDCPGFFDIRGEEEKICGSILTEMVVRNARSLRAMVVVDFSSIQAGKGFDFIRLGDTLNKLIPKASNPLFFVFNKVPNGADKESIVKDLKEMVLCRGIDLQTEVRRCLDDLNDPRSESWSIEQQHQDALGLLPDEVKNNPNIRKHVEEFVAISVTLSSDSRSNFMGAS